MKTSVYDIHWRREKELREKGYVEFTGGSYDLIIKDAGIIIRDLTIYDCEHDYNVIKIAFDALSRLPEEKRIEIYGKEFTEDIEKDAVKNNFEWAYSFILKELNMTIKALNHYDFKLDELISLVERKASEWYKMPADWVEHVIAEPVENISPEEIISNDLYTNILQGKATNALVHTSKKSMVKDPAVNQGNKKTGEVEIILEDFSNLNLNANTFIVLDMLTEKLSQNLPYSKRADISLEQIDQNRKVSIDISEYMERRNIKDRKEATKQLKNSITALFRTEIHYKESKREPGKRKKTEYVWNMHILDAMGTTLTVKNGAITAQFSLDIAKYLSQSQVMPYPRALSSIKLHKNPHSYYIGRKLCEHYNMNVAKQNAKRISVKRLIEALPDLPKYEDVINDSKHISKLIIDPFERDINALQETYNVLSSWQYCNSNGEALNDNQLNSYNYKDWIEWLIEFELTEYPDQTERIEEIENKKAIAEAKRKATKK